MHRVGCKCLIHRLNDLCALSWAICYLVGDDGEYLVLQNIPQCFLKHISEGPKPATKGGVNGSRLKFLLKSIRRPISQNHHKPSRILGEVWNSYGRAKPTQTSPRTSERKLGSKLEKQRTWQTQTSQTAYSDRSGWKKKSQTGQTGRSQKARNQSFKGWISIKWSLNSMKLEGYLHIYPVNISPRDLSQKIRGTREFEER